jgi:hypothetical protein
MFYYFKNIIRFLMEKKNEAKNKNIDVCEITVNLLTQPLHH